MKNYTYTAYELDHFSNSNAAIDDEGTIYIGAQDRKIYAIHTDFGGLANTPWPKAAKDNANTSRQEKQKIDLSAIYYLLQ